MKTLIASFILAIFSVSSIAQQVDHSKIDTSLLMDDVLIVQNRINTPVSQLARNIQVVDKEYINTLPVTNVPEMLQYIGGVDIRRRGINGVQSDPGLRGSTFNQVLILINGIRMSDPQTGHHNMNLPVALEDIERVEIVKGPAARIYGMNAMAGAINIITKTKTTEDFTMSAGANISAFQTLGANIKASYSTKHINQTLSLSRQGSEGYRYNTDYNINTIYYNADIRAIKKAPINLQAGFTEREFGANGFYANEAFVDQYEEVRTGFVSASSKIFFGKLFFTPKVSWRTNKDEYVFLRQNPSFFMNEHKSNSYIGELHGTYISKLGVSGIGVDFTKETLSSNNLGERERNILGLFLEHRLSFLENKLGITAGFYGNKVSDYDFKIYPGVDVSYQINKNINLFGTANWSDRIPTYTNLYYSSSSEQGNPDLVSESAAAYEAGLKYNTSTVSMTVSGFIRNNQNLIDWAKDSLNQAKWQALNFNEVNVSGIDFNGTIDLGKMAEANKDIKLNIAYTYINSEVVDPEKVEVSRYALDNLSQQFIAGVQFDILKNVLDLSTQFRYLDRVSLEDYSLLDMKLNFKTKGFSAFISGNNLRNTSYRETNLVPMPGRWFGVGVRFF